MSRLPAPHLAVLCLDEPAQSSTGGLNNPSLMSYPVSYYPVRGATLTRTLNADPSLVELFKAAARNAARKGAIAITSNCGFTLPFQDAVSRAVSCTVSLSSLSLLPYLGGVVDTHEKIGIITFDAPALERGGLLASTALHRGDRLRIAGLEGGQAWRMITGPEGRYDWRLLHSDALNVAMSLCGDDQLGAILIECAALCGVTSSIRRLSRVPVVDFVTLADRLMKKTYISTVRRRT